MVDEEIEACMPILQTLSSDIKEKKARILNNFNTILEMKSELMLTKQDGQYSHTFTNSKGTMRISLGRNTIDSYTDTVEEGIKMVREYIESLAAEIAERKAAAAAKDEEPPTPVDKPPADAPPVSDSDTPDGVSDEEWEIIRQLRLEKSTRTTTASRYISS